MLTHFLCSENCAKHRTQNHRNISFEPPFRCFDCLQIQSFLIPKEELLWNICGIDAENQYAEYYHIFITLITVTASPAVSLASSHLRAFLFAFVSPVDWCNDCQGRVLEEILWYVFVCNYDSNYVTWCEYDSWAFICALVWPAGVYDVFMSAQLQENWGQRPLVCVCAALCCFPTAVSGTSSPSCAGQKM